MPVKFNNKVFTKAIHMWGNLISSYVFESEKKRNEWLATDFVVLKKIYGQLKYTKFDLPSLKVGDTCKVMGDGNEKFKILSIVKYSKDRYGFVLDSGWVEEVAKCRK